MDTLSPTKTCFKCGDDKLKDHFTKDRGAKDGRSSVCRSCMKAVRTNSKHLIGIMKL